MKFLPLQKRKFKHKRSGVAIFIAVIAVASLMLIATAIANLSYKEQIISQSGRDSKVAFFAADSGIECALFHDLKGGKDPIYDPFSFAIPGEDEQGDLYCNGDTILTDVDVSGNTAVTTFYFNLSDGAGDNIPSCAVVSVTKTLTGSDIETIVQSSGYNNTCSGTPANPVVDDGARNLERALRVEY